MAAEIGFKINGVFYENPFASWDLDDAEILYERTGLLVEDWLLADDEETTRKFRDPKVIRTIAAVAYWKKHKDEAFDDIYRDVVGGVTLESIYETLLAGDGNPPASTTEPDKPSPSGTVISNASSGDASTTSSALQDSLRAATGTSG